MQYGIKSITMDDVARHLGMSKKTLYLYVKDKKELVLKAMQYNIESDVKCTFDITNRGLNAIDEMLEIAAFVTEQIKKVQPAVLFDIQKYYPEAWALHEQFKYEHVVEHLTINIEKGIAEGLYRSNLVPEMIAKFYVSKLESVFDPRLFPTNKYTVPQLYNEFMRYHLLGICSYKGAEYLVNKIFNNE